MKLLTLFLLLPFLAFSQDQVYRVHKNSGDSLILIRYPHSKTITVRAGSTYKYTIPDKDTARFFQSETGEPLQATITYSKPGGVVIPDPVKPDLVTNIDNVDTRNKYTGTWEHASATTWLSKFHNVTGSYTFTNGSFLETTFDGYKIEWYTELKSDKGYAGISIDGGAEVDLDLYNPTTLNNSQLAWTSPALTNGPHKIRIRYLGKKNPAASVPTIIHDYFKVYKKQ